MKDPISITGMGSISPLGSDLETIWNAYLSGQTCIQTREFEGVETIIGALNDAQEKELLEVQKSTSHYKNVDKTVLMALFAARKAIQQSGWEKGCLLYTSPSPRDA